MLVAIDAVGIRGHGGAAVLCELVHWFPKVRPEWKWHVFLFEQGLREFDDPPACDKMILEYTHKGNKGLARLDWVNKHLKKRIIEIGADAVFSFANIGSNNSCVPQVVFVQQTNTFFSEGLSRMGFLMRCRMHFLRYQILKGAKASRAVIVQTEALQDKMVELAPELEGKIHVIPSGYRTRTINPMVRPEIKALIDNASCPRLVYISLPRPHKNHISLIRALPTIVEAFPTISLILTEGNEDPHDPGMGIVRKRMKDEIQQYGLKNHVIRFKWLTPDEVDYALAASDLMVFPSLAESFGLPLVEAMAAGCPVAAADLPYAHDVAGDSAIYFDPNSPKALAECVISVLKSPETLRNLRKLSKERSVFFSYEKMANQIVNLIEKAAEGKIQ